MLKRRHETGIFNSRCVVNQGANTSRANFTRLFNEEKMMNILLLGRIGSECNFRNLIFLHKIMLMESRWSYALICIKMLDCQRLFDRTARHFHLSSASRFRYESL